jgi:hypothetical protein
MALGEDGLSMGGEFAHAAKNPVQMRRPDFMLELP